jgi:hypothetical protein
VSVVDRLSSVLERRLSRRSFVVRSAFAGSALTAGGVDFLVRPGTAYAQICSCGNLDCDCSSTCCAGYTEFCCVTNGGYNYCPSNTIMGGWWMAEGSIYCDGPRYYMDCNGICSCTDGCGDGYQFCDTSCDGLSCGCAEGSCDNYLSGCFQFRYGQCNQDVSCIGRIHCRVVTCVPPWEIDPSCTMTVATDNGTADQNAACLTPGPTPPPPPTPQPPPCPSASTQCKAVGIALSTDSKGYGIVTSFGKMIGFGDEDNHGGVDYTLEKPVTAIVGCPAGGYWFVNGAGRVFAFGLARFHGDAADAGIESPVVAMAHTPSGKGYWLVTQKGWVLPYGDAAYHGDALSGTYPSGFVGIAPTPTGKGYWLTTADGRVLSYGDATNHGNVVDTKLTKPVVGMTSHPTAQGYWLVTGTGAVYAFGAARNHGNTTSDDLTYPIVGMSRTVTGKGYILVSSDGRIFTFGDAHFYGSAN